jgi:hypothetical protein
MTNRKYLGLLDLEKSELYFFEDTLWQNDFLTRELLELT